MILIGGIEMSIGWFLFEELINAMEALIIYFIFQRKLASDNPLNKPMKKWQILGAFIEFLLTSLCNNLGIDIVSTPVIVAIYTIIYSISCYKSTLFKKVLWGSVPSIILAVSNFIAMNFISYMFPADFEILLSPTTERFIMCIMYMSICTLLSIIVYNTGFKAEGSLPPLLQVLMIVIAVVGTIGIMIVNYYFVYLTPYDINTNLLAVLLCIMLAITLGTIATFYAMARSYKKRNEIELELAQTELELEHSRHLSQAYDTLREWRHDIKNQLGVLYNLAENNDTEHIKQYIKDSSYSLSNVMTLVDTKNPALDAILSNKLIEAQLEGIKVESSFAIPANLDILSVDICSIISNLFDNAIEAVRNCDDKWIKIEISPVENMLHIYIANPTNGVYSYNGDTLSTTKSDKKIHGIGLKRVKSIVERYSGQISIKPNKNSFEVDILLYMGWNKR